MKRLLTLRTVRRISQVFFFSLFLFFVFVTDLRYLKGYPVSLFLELDPLVAFATAITTPFGSTRPSTQPPGITNTLISFRTLWWC